MVLVVDIKAQSCNQVFQKSCQKLLRKQYILIHCQVEVEEEDYFLNPWITKLLIPTRVKREREREEREKRS